MKWSLSSILRTLTWTAVGLSVVAVGLGRYGRSEARKLPTYQAAAARYQGVNMHCSGELTPQPCFLDRETGTIVNLDFSPEDALDYAVCSPWRDEHGQFQAAARWMKRAGKESDYLPQDFGMARFTVPEGRLIDRVRLDHVPIGEPCWVPGATPQILFAAGDGNLYRYEFAGSNGDPLDETRECVKTQPIAWQTAPPGTGLLYIRDLVWPSEAKLGRRLLASVSYREDDAGTPRMTLCAIWWLQLSDDATAVVAAGPLTVPEPEDNPHDKEGIEQRLPNIVERTDGGLALAYLSRRGTHSLWELRVASITIDPATGVPTVGLGRSQGLEGGFLPSTPTFSADGRSVYGIRRHEQFDSQLVARRYPVTEVLAQIDGAPRGGGLARAEPAISDSGAAVPITGVLREPSRPRAESTLLGWANLGIFDPSWLVKTGTGRHAGE